MVEVHRGGRRHACRVLLAAASAATIQSLPPTTITTTTHTHTCPPQAALTREEAKRRQRSLDRLGVRPFPEVLAAGGARPLARGATTTLQLNIGLYCNQACRHCHVESSPK